MRITKVEIYRVNLHLRTPLRLAFGSVKQSTSIIVKLHTHEGTFGIGEASPSIHESKDSIVKALDRIVPVLDGLDIASPSLGVEEIDRKVIGNPSAKAAVDIALHDILGKEMNKSVRELMSVDNNFRNEVETDLTLSLGKPSEMAKSALNATTKGFHALKMKVGNNPSDDFKRVEAVRQIVGPNIAIRIDANQGWTPSQAIKLLGYLEPLGIEFVEQPVNASDIRGLKQVRENSRIPIMADESVFSPQDAQMLIDNKAVDLLNIKLMKCGGLVNASKISSIAQSANVKCMIGCMMESQVGITAGAQLAAASSNIPYVDLDSDFFIKEQLVTSGGSEILGSKRTIPSGNGLGINSLDPKLLGKPIRKYDLT